MTHMQELGKGSGVRHSRLGEGTVIADIGETAVVRFAHGIEECLKTDLQAQRSLQDRVAGAMWDPALDVVTRIQAHTIRGVNNVWGVFTRSQIDLLPHQLWVCRQVTRDWPFRWLVADDVGLGKTIEAGLIMTPLISEGRAKRILVLTPASLAPQWQYRLRTMFDIRMALYTPDADREKTGFWDTHDMVVASYHTLRMDRHDRQNRLFGAEPWDLVVVDEAHHLNSDEHGGSTLGYDLVDKLQQHERIESMVFFTGTPHRGKNFGFLSLLKLLRPGRFDPNRALEDQLSDLHHVMIRNNKYAVTDLQGNCLFQEPVVESKTFTYTPEEKLFYDRLSEFILAGRAYASTLSASQQRTAVLVLITMQKLASSSVAAIRSALEKRVLTIRDETKRLGDLELAMKEYKVAEDDDDGDRTAGLEEQLLILSSAIRLQKDEEAAIQELLTEARAIVHETKISEIVDLVSEQLTGKQVLFFTEYKATQALLLSELQQRFGDDCATFINGDERLDRVADSRGQIRSVRCKREVAAGEFNAGRRRFLIATEAAGEGIDLQENCWNLVHVDLPWNPMRLHQRVGRINRYGQTRQVHVHSFRNPDTVESRIWELLNEKIARITVALAGVMKDPENVFELVLGMTPPSVFRGLFSDGTLERGEGLDDWFDQRTATFGGQDAIDTVRKLVGHVARFDFAQVSERLPKVDLPDLEPFMRNALAHNGHRLTRTGDARSFVTPEAWRKGIGIFPKYEGVHFDRHVRDQEGRKRLLGVGHVMIDRALAQMSDIGASAAVISAEALPEPLFIFRVSDRVTERSDLRPIVCGLLQSGEESEPAWQLLHDWQLLGLLNLLPFMALTREYGPTQPAVPPGEAGDLVEQAEVHMERYLPELGSEFSLPFAELMATLFPSAGSGD